MIRGKSNFFPVRFATCCCPFRDTSTVDFHIRSTVIRCERVFIFCRSRAFARFVITMPLRAQLEA